MLAQFQKTMKQFWRNISNLMKYFLPFLGIFIKNQEYAETNFQFPVLTMSDDFKGQCLEKIYCGIIK